MRRSAATTSDKVLADAFESMVALAYEELGLAGNKSVFVLRHLEQEVDRGEGSAALTNPKSALSEACQERNGQPPEYRLVGRTGRITPVHKVVVLWGQEDAVFGEGAGLKAAQMDAAQAAMSTWFGETS